eukprot:355730-Chlamydomonas_euryale.AAC.3
MARQDEARQRLDVVQRPTPQTIASYAVQEADKETMEHCSRVMQKRPRRGDSLLGYICVRRPWGAEAKPHTGFQRLALEERLLGLPDCRGTGLASLPIQQVC